MTDEKQTGGVNARTDGDLQIGGNVVGRDSISSTTHITHIGNSRIAAYAVIGLVAVAVAAILAFAATSGSTPQTPTAAHLRSLKSIAVSEPLPDWASDPLIGSIIFSKMADIEHTGRVEAYLQIRTENFGRVTEPKYKLVAELSPGEKLCGIQNAAFNSDDNQYWLGLRLHCNTAGLGACSYKVLDDVVWATLEDVSLIVADKGAVCP